MQVVELSDQFLFRSEQFPYFFIGYAVLLSIFLEIAVKINNEIEIEFMSVFECLPLLLIVLSSVDINKQILWLVSDVSYFFMNATVDLHFKIELIIQSFVKTASSWV